MREKVLKIWADFNSSGFDISGIWAKSWKTLDNTNDGFAIKKAIVALFSITTVILVFKFTDYANFLTVLSILLGFITSMLIVRTIEKKHILKSNSGKLTPDSPVSTSQANAHTD